MFETLKLGDLCTLRAGSAFKTHFQGNKTGLYPFIKVSDMNLPLNEVCIRDANNWIEEHVRAEIKAKPFPPGTTVFAKIGEALKHNRVRFLVMDTIVDNNMMGAIPNRRAVDPKFFYYLLSDFDIASTATGTALPYLTVSTLVESTFQVPPLPIQHRIAGILSAYDELIENSQRRIKILAAMARAIYREWFVHFRFPGHESVPLVRSSLGEIPKGWEVKRLDAACRSIEDGDWIETKDQGGEDYRLLQISNIGVGEFIETGTFRYVSQQTFDRLRCNEIVPDDLLVARMPTPIGRGWLATKMPWRMITAVDVAIIRADRAVVHPLFLVQAWNETSNLQRIAAQASGTTRLRITRRQLAAMEFVIPPRDVQHQFANVVQPHRAMIEALRRQIQTLRRNRDLLLPRLLSGQHALPEV